MKPMVLTSTHFISYDEINVEDTDIIEDAWGFNKDFYDVLGFLGRIDPDPGEELTDQLIKLISEKS